MNQPRDGAPTAHRDETHGETSGREGATRATGVETGGEWAQPRATGAPDGPTDWEHHDPEVTPHPDAVRAGGPAGPRTAAPHATESSAERPASDARPADARDRHPREGSGSAPRHEQPRGAGAVEARVAAPVHEPGRDAALFSDEERRRLHARWDELQGTFIDDPRHAVTEADRLVRDTIGSLHDLFERDRVQLEAVWSRGEEVSTEDLRLSLQRYRAFFDRLLSV